MSPPHGTWLSDTTFILRSTSNQVVRNVSNSNQYTASYTDMLYITSIKKGFSQLSDEYINFYPTLLQAQIVFKIAYVSIVLSNAMLPQNLLMYYKLQINVHKSRQTTFILEHDGLICSGAVQLNTTTILLTP